MFDEECPICHKIRRIISECQTSTYNKDELVQHLEDLEQFRRAVKRNGKK